MHFLNPKTQRDSIPRDIDKQQENIYVNREQAQKTKMMQIKKLIDLEIVIQHNKMPNLPKIDDYNEQIDTIYVHDSNT